jgi:S1-C subfamily serine protease
VRAADELPGAGTGYRLMQFTAPASPGSSGGVLFDRKGAAVALVVAALPQGQNLNFGVPLDAVIGLADAAPSKNFANGADGLIPPESETGGESGWPVDAQGQFGCAGAF